MDFVKGFDMLGVTVMQIPCITGTLSPTSDTEGVRGLLYMDMSGGLYKCTSAKKGQYNWVRVDIEPMIVELTGDTASYTSSEILSHVHKGGLVFLVVDGIHYSLTFIGTGFATFNIFDMEDYSIATYFVYEDGSYEKFSDNIATTNEVNEQLEEVRGQIGDIESALDSILRIQDALIPEIQFTIDSQQYTAKYQMTWEEWVNSSYNTYEFYTDSPYIMRDDSPVNDADGPVQSSDTIDPNLEYHIA